ncbi:strictosidine synthase, partial [Salmonella enterica subsp. enterica]|nr:strictosidine synthase [Salmonella enterica subsp. enterica serovar Paratyphi A]
MLVALKTFSDRLLGRGSAALTVPPLDGALRPNNRLEDAPPGISGVAPDCLTLREGKAI